MGFNGWMSVTYPTQLCPLQTHPFDKLYYTQHFLLLCLNLFSSSFCVCMFVFPKKKKKKLLLRINWSNLNVTWLIFFSQRVKGRPIISIVLKVTTATPYPLINQCLKFPDDKRVTNVHLGGFELAMYTV